MTKLTCVCCALVTLLISTAGRALPYIHPLENVSGPEYAVQPAHQAHVIRLDSYVKDLQFGVGDNDILLEHSRTLTQPNYNIDEI